MKKQYSLLNKFRAILTVVFISCLTISCGKEFLEKKPDAALVIPQTLDDFQALLDNYRFFVLNVCPSTSQTAADDLVITDIGLKALQTYERDPYIWSKDLQMFAIDWVHISSIVTPPFQCKVAAKWIAE